MQLKHNYLRMYRRKAKLTQEDVSFILDLKDYSNISRWELGQRQPDIYILLAYHLLFNIPIEHMFYRQRLQLIPQLSNRIVERIALIKENQPDGNSLERIGYLSSALGVLATQGSNP